MAMITFEDLPSTNTPLNAANLNNNFNELNNILSSGSESGRVKIGNIGIEWGQVNVTSGTSSSTSGGLTFYTALSDDINYLNSYSKAPSVSLTWAGNYINEHTLFTTSRSKTKFKAGGYLFTSGSTRTIAYLVIGVLE